jgi:hypothetical protein
MYSDGHALRMALETIDASVHAYRALLRDHPMDWGEEASRRQQEAADLLDHARTISGALTHPREHQVFADRFSSANAVIERLETLRGQFGSEPQEAHIAMRDRNQLFRDRLIVARLIGGPFDGETRRLDLLQFEGNLSDFPPRTIHLPCITRSEVRLMTYLRGDELRTGEWAYSWREPRTA